MDNETIFIKEIEDKIAEAAGEFEEYHFLLTIPGFGPYPPWFWPKLEIRSGSKTEDKCLKCQVSI